MKGMDDFGSYCILNNVSSSSLSLSLSLHLCMSLKFLKIIRSKEVNKSFDWYPTQQIKLIEKCLIDQSLLEMCLVKIMHKK